MSPKSFLYPQSTFLKIAAGIFFLLFSEQFCAQASPIDSLRSALITAKHDTSRIKTLNKLAFFYTEEEQYDSAIAICKRSIQFAEKINFKKGAATAYGQLADTYRETDSISAALNNYLLSARIKEEIGDKKGLSVSYSNISIIYRFQGNHPLALQYIFKSLKLKEEIGDKKGMGNLMMTLGSIYATNENRAEEKKSYELALKYYSEINDSFKIASATNHLGLYYFHVKNFERAKELQLKSIAMFERLAAVPGLASATGNLGLVYEAMGENDKALECHLKSLELNTKMRNKNGIAASYINAGIQFVSKDKKKARIFLRQGIQLASETGQKEFLANAYERLSFLDSLEGNFNAAFLNYKLHVAYRDSVVNEENTRKIVSSQMQFDFDKKTAADSIRNDEVRRQEVIRHQVEIGRQKMYTYGGIAGFFVMIIVAGISYSAFRNKKKANEEIAKQKMIVEEKQKEILDSIYYARRIQRALITNEKYISRNLSRLACHEGKR